MKSAILSEHDRPACRGEDQCQPVCTEPWISEGAVEQKMLSSYVESD